MSAPSSRAHAPPFTASPGSASAEDRRVRQTQSQSQPAGDLSSSSAGSSQIVSAGAQPSRADQIVYRFYLKTVGVLVDARVSHLHKGERKQDRWFNLSIPDTEVHKADLSIYRLVSAYPPLPQLPAGDAASRSTVPPLLIAFILDTNDIPAGQTVSWNRDGQRLPLDPCLVHPPAPGARRPGIVLERWSFRVTNLADTPSESEMAPPTAYRLGIVHFRALYAFIRLLPAYRLFRRLRRLNTGLRLGIKLWGPEGYPSTAEGLAEAWEVMERDLVGINVPLEHMMQSDAPPPGQPVDEYTFAPLELFGSTYELGVQYRPNVDFEVEDMESVLSERFVDMDEDWFTPTVARHRLQSERAAAASAGASAATSRSVSRQTDTPGLSYTPPVAGFTGTPSTRQMATSSRATPAISTGAAGSAPKEPGSLGAGKWNALAEGLPFASASQMASGGESGSPVAPSPTGATANAIPYRRLSAHSLQPFRSISASPSTSVLRGPPGAVPFPAVGATRPAPTPLPGSLPRTSEFLSSSGRSFSHAQMAHLMQHSPSTNSPIGLPSDSPPLSFTKQAVRQPMTYSTSSPFVPSSLDRETSLPGSPGLLPKRYSASFTQRRLPSGSPEAGLPGALPSSLLRRQSTQSGLRHSVDEPREPQGPEADNEDVHAFLRALDSWTPPASIAPHTSPRTTTSALAAAQGSTTSSNSASAHPSSRVSSVSSSAQRSASLNRQPLTRQHVDDMLKRMIGSFSANDMGQSTSPRGTGMARVGSNTSERSITSGPGLLSASRPSPPHGISPRSNASPLPASGLRHGSLPRSGALPFAAPPHLTSTSTVGARSLPVTHDEAPGPLSPVSPPNALSPQTTGGTERRRGPVLVRGGFEPKTTASSPSCSPVRDYREYRAFRSGVSAERDSQSPEGYAAGTAIRRATTLAGPAPRVGRTAPSSLGADVEEAAATGFPFPRGRASEGSTSPTGPLLAARSADRRHVEGLMARLALAEQQREQGPFGP